MVFELGRPLVAALAGFVLVTVNPAAQQQAAPVVVLDHPWFGVSDEQGHFELPSVPTGEPSIAALHERLGDTTAQVRVEFGKAATADFVLPVPAR